MSASIQGRDVLSRNLQRFARHANRTAARLLAKYMLLIETRAMKNLEGGTSGPRRIDKGELRAKIRSYLEGLVAHIVSEAGHSVHVHFGTSKMEPNNYLDEALMYYQDLFLEEYGREVMNFST